MTWRLVAFAGPAGVGKSTAAALLAAEGGWRMLSYADPLRALSLALHPEWTLIEVAGARKDCVTAPSPLGWTAMEDILSAHVERLTGQPLDYWSRLYPDVPHALLSELQGAQSPRAVHRLLGDWIKRLYPDAFTARMAMQWRETVLSGRSAVIDDVRFESEAAQVRLLGGRVVHLRRPGVDYRRDHNSELGVLVQAEDRVVANRGDVQALRAEIFGALQEGTARWATA